MDSITAKVASIRKKSEDVCFDCETLKKWGLTGIDLRSYQEDGVQWLAQRYVHDHGCILGDEMGLGKTCQTISFLVYLWGNKESRGPHLVLSPLSVLANWQNELARFAPKLKVVSYVGDKERRSELQNEIHEDMDNISVILTTYELCLKDATFLQHYKWHTLVVDEAHRLKNRESLLYQTLLEFFFSHRLLLTGTPVQNNLKELYTLLAFVAPLTFQFRHEPEFVSHFADIEPDSEEARELHSLLQPFLLRRIKSEVVHDLPQRSEVVLFHGLSAMQKKYYKAILTKDIAVFENEYQPTKTRLMNTLMQLRKCVNHPYLFDGIEPEPFELGEHLVEASGKLVIIDQLLSRLKAQGHKVLMFSQMTHMLDILQDYLGYRGYTYERLDGSVRGEERYLAIQNFNQDDDTFIFLLSTKAGGVGLNLASADTVIFVDSDFNPQNDLQAAARAHRIGQKRPVKIIRLIGRSTVEEIILRRAEAKLKLTTTVIEGGQFSLGANKEAMIADNNMQLSDILKFGVDKLLADDESSVENVDFDAMLGTSRNGEWQSTTDEPTQEAQASVAMDVDDDADDDREKNMYVFEGTDYSKTTAEDQKAIDQLVTVEKALVEQSTSEGRMRRSKTVTQFFAALPDAPKKPRKKLTEEEKAERKKKREENAARRAKEEEEEEMRRAQEIKKKLMKRWEAHNYTTHNISLDSEGETDEEDEEEEQAASGGEDEYLNGRAINYVVGDVTMPTKAGKRDAFIVHCVDDSGSWGRGGLFTALSNRSDQPEEFYTQAGKMRDLALGDAHLIPVDDKQSRDEGHDFAVLIVAQHRDRKNNLSGIKLSALSEGLQRIYRAACKHKASVHLPRIGHNTAGFNWYGTERLIRKHLASRGIPTYIYYYPRRNAHKRKQRSPDPEVRESKRKNVDTAASASDSTDVDSSNDTQRNATRTSADVLDKTPPLTKTASAPAPSPDKNAPTLKRATTFPLPQNATLPDINPADDVSIFDGCCIHLYQMDEETSKKLTRYIMAYDGDIHRTIEDSTTHIIVHPSMSAQMKRELREATSDFPEAIIVNTHWLELSIIKQQTLPIDKYEVNLSD